MCLLWLCLALVRRLGVSPLPEDADGVLSLHFYLLTARIPLAAAQVATFGAALRASPMVLRRYHASPRSGPDTPALFAGGLDHLSAAAWVSPPA